MIFSNGRRLILILIILLMTVGQFSVTIYLPSLPAMVDNLKTTPHFIQMTVIFYVLGFGCSQFFYGPVSDVHGRRRVTLCGVMVFVIGSSIACFAHSVQVLLLARLLQGFGIGCGDTMGRAIMCDVFEGSSFVKAASYIGMAAAISPVIAPVIGGYLQSYYNWRANFILLFFYGLFSWCVVYWLLPETNKKRHQKYCRRTYSLKFITYLYITILKNPLFLGYFIPGVAAFLCDIIYNMIAPFILQEKMGLSAMAYGWLAVFTAAGLFLGSIISDKFSSRYSIFQMVLTGLLLLTCSSFLMLLLALCKINTVAAVVGPMILFMIGTGIVYPNTNAGALTPFSHIAGIAGALQGGLQMATTGILSFSVDIANHFDQPQIALALILSIATVSGLVIFYYLIRHRHFMGQNLSGQTG